MVVASSSPLPGSTAGGSKCIRPKSPNFGRGQSRTSLLKSACIVRVRLERVSPLIVNLSFPNPAGGFR